TAHVDLAEHAGRTITTLGLGLHTDEARELQVNLGGLTVAPADLEAPARPRGLEIDRALTSSEELVLRWTMGEFAEVSRYEAYADDAFLGAVYADALYVKGFGGIEGRLELVAVGHDGQRSEPAVLDYDLSLGRVEAEASENGAVTVSWESPCRPGTRVRIESLDSGERPFRAQVGVRTGSTAASIDDVPTDGSRFPATGERPFRAQVGVRKGSTSASIDDVPTNGSRFLATVDDRRSTPVSTISTFADIELTAYPKDFASIQGTSLQLRRPALDDWSTLTVLEDDEPLLFDTTYDQGEREQWIRGRTTRSSLEQTLSSSSSRVVAVLADY